MFCISTIADYRSPVVDTWAHLDLDQRHMDEQGQYANGDKK